MRLLLLPIVVFALIAFQCEKFGDTKYVLEIKNNATHPINYYVAAVGIEHKYPDTALLQTKHEMLTVQAGQSSPWGISMPFEQLFQQLPTDTLSIYVFHPDTLSKYDWTVIRSQYKVLKRFDFSLQDLKARNFVVTYP